MANRFEKLSDKYNHMSVQKVQDAMDYGRRKSLFDFFSYSPITVDIFLSYFILIEHKLCLITNNGLIHIKCFNELSSCCQNANLNIIPLCYGSEDLFWDALVRYMEEWFFKLLRAKECPPILKYNYYWNYYKIKYSPATANPLTNLGYFCVYKEKLILHNPQNNFAAYLTKKIFLSTLPIRPGRKLAKKMYDSLYQISLAKDKIIRNIHRLPSIKEHTEIHQPSKNSVDLLKKICCDATQLENLSHLFRCFSTDYIPSNIIVLRLPSDSNREKSLKIIYNLLSHIADLPIYHAASFRSLLEAKNQEPYINHEFTPILCTLFNHCKIGELTEYTYRKLVKIFYGKKVMYQDSFIGTIPYTNKTPTIYLSYSDAQTDKMKNTFPSIAVMNLDHIDSIEPNEINRLSYEDCLFFIYTFSRLFKNSERINKNLNSDTELVQSFIHKYTRRKKDSIVYADDL